MPETSVETSPVEPRKLRYKQRTRGVMLRSAVRAWARRTFSRDQLFRAIKTLAWVVPLTVLIWIYAEREQVIPLQAFPFTVEVRSTDPSRIVRLVDPADGKMRADLSGPHALLDKVREGLESGSRTVHIDIDAQFSPGRHSLQSARVGNDPFFSQNGVTVSNCMPQELTILVDPLVELELDVHVPPSVTNLAAPAVFQPQKVKVRLPQSLREAGALEAYAQLDGNPDMKTAGPHDLTGIPVALWRAEGHVPIRMEDANVKITPGVVAAKVEVANSDVSYTIDSVPVWVVYPPGRISDDLKAKYDPILARVRVIGPDEKIKAMQSPDFPRPHALFEVSATNQPGVEYTTRPKFELPAGVHVSDEDANRVILYTLEPRKPAE